MQEAGAGGSFWTGGHKEMAPCKNGGLPSCVYFCNNNVIHSGVYLSYTTVYNSSIIQSP